MQAMTTSMNLQDYIDRDDGVQQVDWHPDQPRDWAQQYGACSGPGVRGPTRRNHARKAVQGTDFLADTVCSSGSALLQSEEDQDQEEGQAGEPHGQLGVHRAAYAVVAAVTAVLLWMLMSAAPPRTTLASVGAPWLQPACDVGVYLQSQGARLAMGTTSRVAAVPNDTDPVGTTDTHSLSIIMVQGTTDNLRTLVSGAVGRRDGGDTLPVEALLLTDLFGANAGVGYMHGWHDAVASTRANMLRDHCSEALRRQAALMLALDGWGKVTDPLAIGPACHGLDDTWDGSDAEKRLLALEAGYGRYPHVPAYVGADVQHLGHPAANLVISVGYPFTYEAVAWLLALAKRASDPRGSKLVLLGFGTPVEVVSLVSAACDRLWAPTGIVDITKDIKCAGGSPRSGKRYYMVSLQGNLKADVVARACGGLVH